MSRARRRINDLARYDDVNIEAFRLRLLGWSDSDIAQRLNILLRQVPISARRGELLVGEVQTQAVLGARERAVARRELVLAEHSVNHQILRKRIYEHVASESGAPDGKPLSIMDLNFTIASDTRVLAAMSDELDALEKLTGATPKGDATPSAPTTNILIQMPDGRRVTAQEVSSADLDSAILALEEGDPPPTPTPTPDE